MNKGQVLSLTRSLLKIAGAALAAHGATKAAAFVNMEDVVGLALSIAGLVWSHFNHGDTSPPPTNTLTSVNIPQSQIKP